jgi:predicted acetyltransferase
MQEAMRELAEEGMALSGLYASTQPLYRQVGFEQAGHWFGVRIPLHRIDVKAHGRSVRPLTDTDTHAVQECYRGFAARFNGPLDRGPYVWRRVRVFRDEAFHGFGIEGPHGLDGYLYLAQRRKPETGRHDVALTDLVFLSADAGRALLAFLADFATVGDDALFTAGPVHPALALLEQQKYDVQRREYWMLRIVDVERAIAARGYARPVTATLRLELSDDLIARNAGAWAVRVEGGRGVAIRDATPSAPTIRCSVRGLAAMYTGFFTGREAALAGLAEGQDEALDTATAVFSGGAPWMTDMF